MGRMGITDKAKEFADVALEKAGEYSEKAAEKAAELSDVAREKAPRYVDRAADIAVKAVDATAAGVDKATRGRFHEKLEGATSKVGESLDRPRPGRPTTVTAAGVEQPDAPAPAAADVAGQEGRPITPAATNPEATDAGPDAAPGPKG
jgi:hypothetical protein